MKRIRAGGFVPFAVLATVWLALAGLTSWAAAEQTVWNQFRGPNASGVAPSAKPPSRLEESTLAWRIPVGPGLSSPVIVRDRLFLTAIESERLVTSAFDTTTGRLLWKRPGPDVPLERVHPASSPAASTPCADAHRLYVYFGSFGLLCYDHDGNQLWKREIPTPRTLYGTATSPILHGENLILVLDDEANLPDSELSRSRVVAFRKTSGEPVWDTARPLVRSGWSTPSIWKHADGEELVVLGSGRVCSYDPVTGTEHWFTTGYSRETIAVPVFGNGLVYVSSAMLGGVADDQPDREPFWKAMLHFDADGDGRIAREEITADFTFPFRPELPPGHPGFGLPLPADPVRRKERQESIFDSVDKDQDGFWTREEFLANMSFRHEKPRLAAIRPGGRGNVTDTHVEWQMHRSIPEIPSPLFYEGLIYMVRNGGLLSAVDAREGELLYTERLNAPGQYSASPVAAGQHLYLLSNLGVVTVVRAGATFEVVGRHELNEPALITPAIDHHTLYIRSASHLRAFRSP